MRTCCSNAQSARHVDLRDRACFALLRRREHCFDLVGRDETADLLTVREIHARRPADAEALCKLRIAVEPDCSNTTWPAISTKATVAADGSGARQNSTLTRSSAKTMRWSVASVITAVAFAHQTSASTPTAIAANSA